jgi:hypothetical protein
VIDPLAEGVCIITEAASPCTAIAYARFGGPVTITEAHEALRPMKRPGLAVSVGHPGLTDPGAWAARERRLMTDQATDLTPSPTRSSTRRKVVTAEALSAVEWRRMAETDAGHSFWASARDMLDDTMMRLDAGHLKVWGSQQLLLHALGLILSPAPHDPDDGPMVRAPMLTAPGFLYLLALRVDGVRHLQHRTTLT